MTPDLAELKRIAEAATQSEWSAEQLEHPRYNAAPPSWEFWVNIPTGTDLFLDAGPSPDEPNAQFTANTPHGYSDHDGQAWRDVQFIATAKPKVVLALIARIEALEAESRDLTKALTGLTCGGSEFFIRKGERYVADIKACVEWVQRRDRVAHDRIMKVTAERDEAKGRTANLLGDRHE